MSQSLAENLEDVYICYLQIIWKYRSASQQAAREGPKLNFTIFTQQRTQVHTFLSWDTGTCEQQPHFADPSSKINSAHSSTPHTLHAPRSTPLTSFIFHRNRRSTSHKSSQQKRAHIFTGKTKDELENISHANQNALRCVHMGSIQGRLALLLVLLV